jgi:prophage regulatory protein
MMQKPHEPINQRMEALKVAPIQSRTKYEEPINLLRLDQVLVAMPLSRTTFINMVKRGEFPKPIKIGRVCFWIENEVQAYLRKKAAESRNTK